MRYFKYNELVDEGEDSLRFITDEDILRDYYPWWCAEMTRVERAHLIDKETCIKDWVTVHWAWEVPSPDTK